MHGLSCREPAFVLRPSSGYSGLNHWNGVAGLCETKLSHDYRGNLCVSIFLLFLPHHSIPFPEAYVHLSPSKSNHILRGPGDFADATSPVRALCSRGSFQPSFFSNTSCFPWGSDGFLKRKDPWKEWNWKCPLDLLFWGATTEEFGFWGQPTSLSRAPETHTLSQGQKCDS